MKKKFTQLSCIALALCLVLCGNLPAIATDGETPAPDTSAPVITHTPVQYARYGEALSVTATVTDDTAVANVCLYWRATGAADWTEVTMTAGEENTFSAELSADAVNGELLEYYLSASDGTNASMLGSEDKPLEIIVNRGIYITAVSPSRVDISAVTDGITATVTGENFSEGMTVMLGDIALTYTLDSQTQITLQLPPLPICTQDLRITKDENHATLLEAFTFYDKEAYIKLDAPIKAYVGQTVWLSLRASASCPIDDVAVTIQLDPQRFEFVDFIPYSGNSMATASCSAGADGSVTIGLSSPMEELDKTVELGYLLVKVKYTEDPLSSTIGFTSAQFQGVDVDVLDCPVDIHTDLTFTVKNLPDSLQILEGTLPDCSNWELEITYPGFEEKETIPVTVEMLAPVNSETFSITYMGVSTTFACRQLSKDLFEKLEIITPPAKTVYIYGESFDTTGMQAVLKYKDETPGLEVTNYTVAGYDAEKVGAQTVTIRCGEFEATLDVTVNPRDISSEVYTVRDGYLLGLPAGSTAQTLAENLNDSQYIRIFDGETEVEPEGTLATGMTVKLMNGEAVLDSLTLIVTGDVNGDGKISILDMVSIKSHNLDIQTLADAAALAADYNCDGKLSVLDYVQVKALLLGLEIN